MEDNIYIALKKRMESFTTIPDEDWVDFRNCWQRRQISKGTFITKAGQVEKYFYFVHTGVHRMFGDNNGAEVDVGYAYENEFSGVYDSFLAQQPSDLFLESITDSDVLYIDFKRFNEQMEKHRSIERAIRLFNAQMLMAMARRQMESRAFTARERYNRLVENSPQIFQKVPLKNLATYIGMTPETLSRLRKQVK